MEEALGNMLRSTLQMPFGCHLEWQGSFEAGNAKTGFKKFKNPKPIMSFIMNNI